MNTKDINKSLKEEARSLGLCDQWYKDWGNRESLQNLIEKYLKGIDFCIEHDYPKLDFARKVFPKKLLLANGIFLDETINATNLVTAVLLGKSKVNLRYDGIKTGNIYVRHNSIVTIEATDGARVFVETYEDCEVHVVATGGAKVFVYWHGGTVTHNGNVTIRDKRKAGE